MEKLQRNQKYPGKFSIQIDSLKNTSFDAQLYYADKDFIEMEVSYSSSLVETVELTNFIEHTFDFYDVQGFIFIGSKKHNISLLHCSLNSDNCKVEPSYIRQTVAHLSWKHQMQFVLEKVLNNSIH